MTGRNRNAFCSFCRKSYRDVGPLVEGPGEVYICGECIELCDHIIEQEKRRRGRAANASALEHALDDVETRLEPWLAGQDRTVQEVARLLRRHRQRHIDGPQIGDFAGAQSVALLLGPRRSTKLLLARLLGRILGNVPVAHVTAAVLHQQPPHDLAPGLPFHELLQASDFDLRAAERGVLFIDQMESAAVQPLVLEVLNGQRATRLPREMELDVSKILFLCGAELSGVDESISVTVADRSSPPPARS